MKALKKTVVAVQIFRFKFANLYNFPFHQSFVLISFRSRTEFLRLRSNSSFLLQNIQSLIKLLPLYNLVIFLVAQNKTVGTFRPFSLLFSFILTFIGRTVLTRSIVFFSKSSNVRSCFPSLQFGLILCSQFQYNFLPLLSIIFPFLSFHYTSLCLQELSPCPNHINNITIFILLHQTSHFLPSFRLDYLLSLALLLLLSSLLVSLLPLSF